MRVEGERIGWGGSAGHHNVSLSMWYKNSDHDTCHLGQAQSKGKLTWDKNDKSTSGTSPSDMKLIASVYNHETGCVHALVSSLGFHHHSSCLFNCLYLSKQIINIIHCNTNTVLYSEVNCKLQSSNILYLSWSERTLLFKVFYLWEQGLVILCFVVFVFVEVRLFFSPKLLNAQW